MVALVDYDSGNTASVEKAFRFLGEEVCLTADPEIILQAERVVLPGVGAFGDAMGKLKDAGLAEPLVQVANSGKPFLGICVGMQLLFEESEESPGVAGLGILPGRFRKFPEDQNLKVPQIGWNALSFPKESRLFDGIATGTHVYFVHSYYLPEEMPYTTAVCEYGVTVCAAVEKGNLFACQFHPEKSADPGLRILKNFLTVPVA